MTPAAIRAAVLSILGGIAPEVDLAAIRPDADLRDALDIDSMDFLRFVVRLDERLGVSVPEKDYARVRTLASCIAYLSERGASERGPPRPG
ncbi:acyl carrier protein [Anaeromyxobacter sp. Red801]|uniref:acyl carrier protein n=1 Tax=Anaeromyxobacter sp. Red801 TaxID=3411632 RepID=UPI003BA20CDE